MSTQNTEPTPAQVMTFSIAALRATLLKKQVDSEEISRFMNHFRIELGHKAAKLGFADWARKCFDRTHDIQISDIEEFMLHLARTILLPFEEGSVIIDDFNFFYGGSDHSYLVIDNTTDQVVYQSTKKLQGFCNYHHQGRARFLHSFLNGEIAVQCKKLGVVIMNEEEIRRLLFLKKIVVRLEKHEVFGIGYKHEYSIEGRVHVMPVSDSCGLIVDQAFSSNYSMAVHDGGVIYRPFAEVRLPDGYTWETASVLIILKNRPDTRMTEIEPDQLIEIGRKGD